MTESTIRPADDRQPDDRCPCGHRLDAHMVRGTDKFGGTCTRCNADQWCGGPVPVAPKRLSVSEATVIVDTLVLGAYISSNDSRAAIMHLLVRSGSIPGDCLHDLDAAIDRAFVGDGRPRAEFREDPEFMPLQAPAEGSELTPWRRLLDAVETYRKGNHHG